jgi:ribosomal protein S8
MEAMGIVPLDDQLRKPHHERTQMATDEMVILHCSERQCVDVNFLAGHGTIQEKNAEVKVDREVGISSLSLQVESHSCRSLLNISYVRADGFRRYRHVKCKREQIPTRCVIVQTIPFLST